ncbi:MAG: hypothetical protein J5864_06455 [Oscillospiraceae bacterium]|nr:hypothetical protein [Oscillospiraceae bacterium]
MKFFRKTAAAVTAFAMIASASSVLLPAADLFITSEVSADEAGSYGYAASVSTETYDVNSLKTLVYYKENNLYKDDVPADNISSLENNLVVEVKVNIDKNSGFYLGQLRLEFEEGLTFVGCKNYQKDGKATVSNFENIEDGPVSVSGSYNKVVIMLKDKSNVTETGELLTLLFALPEKPETGKAYNIGLSAKTKFVPWDPEGIDQTVNLKNGSVTLTDSKTSPTVTPTTTPTAEPTVTPTTTPTAEPTVTPTTTPTTEPTETPTAAPTAEPTVIPTTLPSPDLNMDSLKNPVKLAEGASIDIDVPAVTAASGTKQVELKVKLKDFAPETDAFDYAAFGFNLPAGFTVADVKKSDKIASMKQMDALTIAAIEAKTDFKSATGDYYAIGGIDASKLGKDEEILTVVVNVPENATGKNDVKVASIFGKLVDSKISIIDNGAGEKLYTANNSSITVADATVTTNILKGDFNLDGKVSQTDATFMLRYLLESSISDNKNEVLYNLIKDNISDNLKNESKEKIFELAMQAADVDGTEEGKSFKQTDATYVLRAVVTGSKIDNDYWKSFFA